MITLSLLPVCALTFIRNPNPPCLAKNYTLVTEEDVMGSPDDATKEDTGAGAAVRVVGLTPATFMSAARLERPLTPAASAYPTFQHKAHKEKKHKKHKHKHRSRSPEEAQAQLSYEEYMAQVR